MRLDYLETTQAARMIRDQEEVYELRRHDMLIQNGTDPSPMI